MEETLSGAVARLKRVEAMILKNQMDIRLKIENYDKQARSCRNSTKWAEPFGKSRSQKHAHITKQLATVQQQLNGLEMNIVTTEVRAENSRAEIPWRNYSFHLL